MAELLSYIEPGTWLLFFTFWSILALTAASRERRLRALSRKPWEWAIDTTCVLIQGAGIPLLQHLVVFAGLLAVVPELQGSVALSGPLAILCVTFGVDYLYYWNHRLLHSNALWPIHLVHHTSDKMDLLVTSRNTLWSSLLLLYLWVNGAAIFLLEDPSWWLLGVGVTAALDLWRHSGLQPRGALARLLGTVLILPNDHAGHHSTHHSQTNYGANFNLWDRLHGSWRGVEEEPAEMGIPSGLSLGRMALWPFGGGSV